MSEKSELGMTGVLGYCLAISALQFIAVPLFMIGNSPGDFGFINLGALAIAGGLLSCCSVLVLLLFYVGLSHWGKSEVALAVIRFLFWWVLIAGFLLPVSISAGMVDAHAAGIDLVHLTLTMLFAVGLTWLSKTAANQYLLAFAIVLSLFSVATSAYSIARSDLTGPAVLSAEMPPESTRLSRRQNVLVISLDGLQGRIVADLLNEDAAAASAFKDFTIYENTLSQSPATQASMIGELFGIRDYKALGNSLEEVKEELGDLGLAEQIPLLRAEDAYQKNYPFGKDAQLSQNDVAVTADSIEFLKFAVARVATRFAVNNFASEFIFAELIDLLAKEGSDELAGRLRNHAGPDWDKRYVAEIHEYDAFVRDLTVSDKPMSYRYLHFAFTHYPVDFDEHCAYRGDDRRWVGSNQNYVGLVNEAQCALSKMDAFLRKLKELDIYEQALIVFKSDHGHPTSYFADFPYNLKINDHHLWGYSRYRPLLMIKPANTTQEQLAMRADLVLLNDLAKTICVHGDDDETAPDCEQSPGNDLLQTDNEDSGYFLYVVPTRASSFTFETHISAPVNSRRIAPLGALQAIDGVALSERDDSAD